ncbi:hypothetical protein BH23CHL8_BH23CHL8_10460 [soil metagenome]
MDAAKEQPSSVVVLDGLLAAAVPGTADVMTTGGQMNISRGQPGAADA